MNRLIAYDRHLATLLVLSFFLPIRLQVFLIIPVVAFWAIRDLLLGHRPNKKDLFAFAVLGALYVLYLSWYPFTPEKYLPELRRQMEYKASLGLLPLAFMLISPATRAIIRRQLIWFVPACFLSCLIANVWYLSRFGLETAANSHVGYRLFFEDISGIHPTYMGMYLCLSLAIIWQEQSFLNRLRGWVVALVYLVFFIFLFALLPKAPLIALGVMMLHYAWAQRKSLTTLLPIVAAFGSALLITYLFVPFATQRVQELTALTQKGGEVVNNSVGMRQLIWQIDWQLIREHWLFGVGPGRIWEILGEQYFFYSLMIGFPLGIYDTHNQFADIWICFGIGGLVLFCLSLLLLFRNAWLKKDALFLYFLIIIAITFFTENVLSNQHGVVFYAFMASVFFFGGVQKHSDLETSDRLPIV